MQPDRWTKIENIFDSAMRQSPEQRAIFLDQACCADSEIQAEVESLIYHFDHPDRRLETTELSAIPPGTQLGPYRIEKRVGPRRDG